MTKEDIYKAIEDYKNHKTDGRDAIHMIEEAARAKLITGEEFGRIMEAYNIAMYLQD